MSQKRGGEWKRKKKKKIKSGEIGIMSSVFFYKNPFFCGYLDLLSLRRYTGDASSFYQPRV